MSEPSPDLLYTPEHEWVAVDGDVATVGVTAYAAKTLGDVVYLDLPKPGTAVSRGKVVGEIENYKTVEELFAPVDGEVIETNQAVIDDPTLVNSDPYGAAWMLKVRFTELPTLLTADEYAKLTD